VEEGVRNLKLKTTLNTEKIPGQAVTIHRQLAVPEKPHNLESRISSAFSHYAVLVKPVTGSTTDEDCEPPRMPSWDCTVQY